MLVARHYYFRSVKTDGLFGMPKLTVFISKDVNKLFFTPLFTCSVVVHQIYF